MYTKHSMLKLPTDLSTKIWRYMSFSKFMNLITAETLFFCRADKFSDKWEGVFPKKMIEKFGLAEKTLPSDDGNEYSPCEWQRVKEFRSHLINCWHLSEVESDAMWKLYSGNDGGIAIQSTIQRFQKSFKKTGERVWIGLVEYEDFNTWQPKNRHFNVGTSNILQAFFLKRKGFEHEKEIRAVINKAYAEHKSETGISVIVDINELIENIYISPTSEDWFEQLIKNVKEKYKFSFGIEKSDLGIKPYM